MPGIDNKIFFLHSESAEHHLKLFKTISAKNTLSKVARAFSMPVFAPVAA